MGDNIYLGDRNGVRTPMQWSYDRNAGFSNVDSEALYAPVITNPNFHYENVNVESESRLPTSLLNWIKKMIRVRKKFTKILGRGDIRFLEHNNRRVLAYIREYEGEKMLCLFNISRKHTFVELDLREFAGTRPVEAITEAAFPSIGELPYFFTLPPKSFFWLSLLDPSEVKGEWET
jgi:Glycosidases